MTWWGENGATQGKVSFYARSGNTSNPEKEWSPWSGPYNSASGATVTCPPARFLQWKAVFQDADKGDAPEVSWVSIAYQPENVAPVVDDIAIQDPGVRVQGFSASPGGPATPAAVQLKMPQRSGTGATPFPNIGALLDTSSKSPKMDVPPQGFEEKGYQSVLWSAHDDNDDDLIFAVYYRGEGEQTWRLLKDKVTPALLFLGHDHDARRRLLPEDCCVRFAFESASPGADQRTRQRALRNPEHSAAHRKSPRGSGGATAKITFDGVSSGLAITRAQYSVDAGEWFIVFPASGLSDAPKESYQIELPGLAPGPHTIAVQISDRFDNTTAAQVTFTVAQRPAK